MFFEEVLLCTDANPTLFGILDVSIAPSFLFYSYIPIILIGIALCAYVFYKNQGSTQSKALFLLVGSFSLFLINEIILWIAAPVGLVSFSWSLALLLRVFVLVSTLYFTYLFVEGKHPSLLTRIIGLIVILPTILFLPTELTLLGFDPELCEGINGPLWDYLYMLEITSLVGLSVYGIRKYQVFKKTPDHAKAASLYLVAATILFLLVYTTSQYYGEFFGLYHVNLIGPLGMVLFIATLTYLMVRFNTFNMRLTAPVALVFTLCILIFSLLFVRELSTVRIVTMITLLLSVGFGSALVRSIKQEMRQKEEIAQLAENLRSANKRLKVLDRMKSEFVSIASHQLRSPLTSIRGYTSMILEGTYGKLSPKLTEVVENINDSAKYMAMSVEDYLNVSRIESGNMKYELSTFDLRVQAEKIVDEMRNLAMKRGLVMIFRSDCDSGCKIRADIGKTRQIIMNILDNSIKYTEKGTITVIAHDDVAKQKMYVTVHDTGVGMDKTALEEVFDKFVRAKNANCVNVNGSGLGLYVAKKMVTDMGGRVWAESEGEGKGSIFHIEFPLAND